MHLKAYSSRVHLKAQSSTVHLKAHSSAVHLKVHEHEINPSAPKEPSSTAPAPRRAPPRPKWSPKAAGTTSREGHRRRLVSGRWPSDFPNTEDLMNRKTDRTIDCGYSVSRRGCIFHSHPAMHVLQGMQSRNAWLAIGLWQRQPPVDRTINFHWQLLYQLTYLPPPPLSVSRQESVKVIYSSLAMLPLCG